MTGSLLLALGGVSVFCVLVAAWRDRVWARRTRARLVAVSNHADVQQAHAELEVARSAFGADVMRYETALAGASTPGSGGGVVTVDTGEAEVLRRAKDASRDRLVSAQRQWDTVRPGKNSHAEQSDWFGSGLVRSWGLGFVGLERAFLRIDHVNDPNVWAVVEVRRRRVGIGIGAERQLLAAVAADATPGTVLDLVGAAFDDVDKAIRPGFAPVRTLRAMRAPAAVRRARRSLHLRASVDDLCAGPSAENHAIVRSRLAAWPDLHGDQATLHLSVTGPTVMLGCWAGRREPELTLLASSGQGVWLDRRRPGGPDHETAPSERQQL